MLGPKSIVWSEHHLVFSLLFNEYFEVSSIQRNCWNFLASFSLYLTEGRRIFFAFQVVKVVPKYSEGKA